VLPDRRGAKYETPDKSRRMAYFFAFLRFKQHNPPASEKNKGFVDGLTQELLLGHH
jgi:hypothetical protein